jgi:hypothetical protein
MLRLDINKLQWQIRHNPHSTEGKEKSVTLNENKDHQNNRGQHDESSLADLEMGKV